MHNHVIGARAEEGQRKKKEARIRTGEEGSRSFVRGKRNLGQRSQRRTGEGREKRSRRRSTGGRGRDAGRRPLRFDRGSRIRPIVEATVDRPRRNENVTLRSIPRSNYRPKIGLEQIACRIVPFLRDCSTIARRAALPANSVSSHEVHRYPALIARFET